MSVLLRSFDASRPTVGWPIANIKRVLLEEEPVPGQVRDRQENDAKNECRARR